MKRTIGMIAAALTCTALYPTAAKSDACTDAVDQGNSMARRLRDLNAADWGPRCSAQYFQHGQQILALRRQRIPILERAEAVCGSRLEQGISSAEYRDRVAEFAASLERSRRLCQMVKDISPDKPAAPKRSDPAQVVTPIRMNAEPACLKSEQGQGIPCITPAGVRQSELTIVVRNECSRSVKIQICFQLIAGGVKCYADFRLAPTGETFSKHQCQVTGRYWVKPLATGQP